MKQKLIALAVVSLLAGGAIFGVSKVSAQGGAFESSLVQKIADKFGLNKNDVQAVFDQAHADQKSQMEAKFKARLDQDVKDGKITAAQEQLILQKRQELESQRQSQASNWKNMTPAQRKAAMQQARTDLQNWATQNGIDIKYLMPGLGMGMHMGRWKNL